MTRTINYEDDLFALSLMVRGLRDIARLEVDAGLFADRIADDARFVDGAAVAALASLSTGPGLVDRVEHLRALRKLLNGLAALHGELAAGRTTVAARLAPRAAEFAVLATDRARDAAAVVAMIEEQEAGTLDDPHVVSAEELRILTAPAEDA
jgi:hypothetical protein